MFLVIFTTAVAVIASFYYYAVHYHTSYFKRRNIPSIPITKPFWNHLDYFTDYDIPFYIHAREWQKKLGNVFGVFLGWRKALVISDLSAAQDILIRQVENFEQKMATPMEDHNKWFRPRTLGSSIGNQYRRYRTLIMQCFTQANVRKICPKINQAALDFVRLIEERHQIPQDVVLIDEHVSEYVMDVLCKLAMGKEECLQFKNPYIEKSKQMMSAYSRTPIQRFAYLCIPLNILWVPLYELYLKIFPDVRNAMVTDFTHIVMRKKKERAELAAKGLPFEQRDFIDMLIDAEDDTIDQSKFEKKLSPKEVIISSTTLIAAGFEATTSGVLTVVRCVVEYPEYQELLRDEIKDYFNEDSSEPIFDQLKNMKLMEAFIKESVRLNQPAPSTLSRRTMKDTVIGNGLHVEKDTYVMVNSQTILRNKEIWGEDADKFRPERFFELTPEQNSAYLVFGAGYRVCPGMQVGIIMAKLVVIRLLQKYSLKQTPMFQQEIQDIIAATTSAVKLRKLSVILEPNKL